MRLIKRTLDDGVVPKEVTWATMLLTPKGRGEYWEVGLVGVFWKVCVAVVNCRLKWSVILHDVLHGSGREEVQG